MARRDELLDVWDLEAEDLDRHRSASGRRCPRELDALGVARRGAAVDVAHRALRDEAAEKWADRERDDQGQAGSQ
jgi:hypothetical protein